MIDSADDDMFALSDEELPVSSPKYNPIEEHLTKQLSDVEMRIQKTTNDIKEVQDTTRRILKSLYSQAQYGEDITSDTDEHLYTADGQPVVKKTKNHKKHKPKQVLVIRDMWKRIVCDQWVIGVVLENTSKENLINAQIYVCVNDEDNINGVSMFWWLKNETFWCLTETIQPRQEVVATVSLDLPKFDKNPFCNAYGTVSYEIQEKEYQTPVPVIRLAIKDTIDNSRGIDFSSEISESILTLKTVSIEKTIGMDVEKQPGTGSQLLQFLNEKSFEEISVDVYVVKTTGCLMNCLVEIFPIVDGKVTLNIYARSSQQMNIITRLLKDQFADIIIEEDILVCAAKALIQELKLYLGDASTAERQRAKTRTDLLIP